MRALFAVLFVVVCAALASPSPSLAQESSEYTAVIKRAVAEFDAGNWVEARVLFQQAHNLNPNARTWRSLGLTAFELRRYVDAIAELEAALADNRKPLNAKAREEVSQLLARAREFVAVYQVSVTPADAEVLVDGKAASLRDGQLFLDPGNHSVVVRAAGYQEARQDLQIVEPRREQLSIELRVAGSNEPEPTAVVQLATPTSQGPTTEPTSARKPRIWTWVLGGSAIAAGGIGIALGVVASGKNDDFKACQKNGDSCGSLKSEGQGMQLGANVSFGVAGALLAGAVAAWFVEGRRTEGDKPSTAFYVNPWGAGVTGRF
ncbi:MAG: hypothetical protein QM778_21740 [Myxococcales bacterium]